MNLSEARKILGLGPEEDPRPHLQGIQEAREHIAAMVRTAPNQTLADRYQKGLIEFDQALAAVREHLGVETTPPASAEPPAPPSPATPPPAPATSPIPEPPPLPAPPLAEEKPVVETAPAPPAAAPPSPPPEPAPAKKIPAPAKTVVLGTVPSAPKVAAADIASEEPVAQETQPSRALSYLTWFLVIFLGATGGAWLYVQNEQTKQNQRLVRIAFLERKGSILIENRRWQEATDAFSEIEAMAPGSQVAQRGYRSIEAGRAEEQTQFIAYWTGQATAELEAGRLDEAVAAARQVLDRYPQEKEAAAILGKIDSARVSQSRSAAVASARAALDERKWESAITLSKGLLEKYPEDTDAKAILSDANAAIQKSAADKARALDLLRQAAQRDNGQFDQQALDWLREAASLAPDNAEIASRLEKLSSYTRTLRVPGDFATPAEALAAARDRDRIVLGAATWKGPLVVNAAVELQGAGNADTRVECPPGEGSAITIGPDAKGARVSGISFRHESFEAGSDRYSVALVRGGNAVFVDCRFTDGSGHGLAVIEGGQASVSRSRFSDNGWNGIAAIGKGSTLEVRECESLNNFEHGIESWDGAAVILTNNRCEGNSRNGIHADNGLSSATIDGNQLLSNREFGLVLASASGGKVTGNTARGNLLGGIVIRSAAAALPVTSNQALLNEGPGLILEKGLSPAAYASNPSTRNKGQQVLADSDLSQTEPAPKQAPEPQPESQPEAAPRATIIEEP